MLMKLNLKQKILLAWLAVMVIGFCMGIVFLVTFPEEKLWNIRSFFIGLLFGLICKVFIDKGFKKFDKIEP